MKIGQFSCLPAPSHCLAAPIAANVQHHLYIVTYRNDSHKANVVAAAQAIRDFNRSAAVQPHYPHRRRNEHQGCQEMQTSYASLAWGSNVTQLEYCQYDSLQK